jgi:mono/diheme cytochrome c family protein
MIRRATAAATFVAGTSLFASVGHVQEDRGAYLVRIMDCSGCHTPGALKGQADESRYLGGADAGFEIPGLGIFYPPNLTPDPETGLGK